jgi:hypothetical protein
MGIFGEEFFEDEGGLLFGVKRLEFLPRGVVCAQGLDITWVVITEDRT